MISLPLTNVSHPLISFFLFPFSLTPFTSPSFPFSLPPLGSYTPTQFFMLFSLISSFVIFSNFLRYLMYSIAGITSSRVLHDSLLKSILGKYACTCKEQVQYVYVLQKKRGEKRSKQNKKNNESIKDKIHDIKNKMIWETLLTKHFYIKFSQVPLSLFSTPHPPVESHLASQWISIPLILTSLVSKYARAHLKKMRIQDNQFFCTRTIFLKTPIQYNKHD